MLAPQGWNELSTLFYQEGDVVMSQTTIYPKWWQLWKKPYTVTTKWVCKGGSVC